MENLFHNIAIYYRPDMEEAVSWEAKIEEFILAKKPNTIFTHENPDTVIILGGDGTILEAVRVFSTNNPLFIGLNLGHVGFLATIRDKENFLDGLSKILEGTYEVSERMTMHVCVRREQKEIYKTEVLGDIYIQNLTGLTDMDVYVDDHLTQHIHGTGAIASTASGSTAYNLSLHGPIVMPDIHCIIVNEILDHNTPTPSMVIKSSKEVMFHICDFRKRNEVALLKDGKPIDVGLWVDGVLVERLEPDDKIHVTKASRVVALAEIEKDYFFKSIKQKFTFK